MEYNLLKERWITVKTLDGQKQKCSICELLAHAHLYASFDTPAFNNIKFYPYDYLLIRFFSTLVARVLDISEDNWEQLLQEKQFNMSIFNAYFQEWENRFNLFDKDYPFMQTFENDLINWPEYEKIKNGSLDNFLLVNPTVPAASRRLFDVNVNPELFISHLSKVTDTTYVLNDDLKNSDIAQAVIKSFPISFEQWAYILLYNNSIVPGVGTGYKTALAGNSGYWETIVGANLFETLLINAPIYKGNRRHSPFDAPIWELDETFEFYDNTTHGIIAGMFVPARIIRGYPNENDRIIDKVIFANLKAKGKLYNDFLDSARSTWALRQEPHAVHRKSESLKENSNPYKTLTIGADTWLLLLGESGQADSGTLSELRQNRLKKLDLKFSAIEPLSNQVSEITSVAKHNRVFDIQIHYRICDSKWGYQKIGAIQGQLPQEYFNTERNVQQHILLMAEYIYFASSQLNYYIAQYNDSNNKTNNAGMKLISQLGDMFGIFNNQKGYIHDIVQSSTEEQIDETYQKYVYKVIEATAECFDNVYQQNRAFKFWQTKKMLIGKLYKHRGITYDKHSDKETI